MVCILSNEGLPGAGPFFYIRITPRNNTFRLMADLSPRAPSRSPMLAWFATGVADDGRRSDGWGKHLFDFFSQPAICRIVFHTLVPVQMSFETGRWQREGIHPIRRTWVERTLVECTWVERTRVHRILLRQRLV